MRNDQIFVLLLVILLPMSGCFEGAVGDAEADEESEGTTVINNYYYNNSTDSQQRIWYSTSDIVDSRWTDGQPYSSGSERCLEFGPSYDSDTGEYLGEECKEMGSPEGPEDWNSSNCSGDLTMSSTGTFFGSSWAYGPDCKIELTTISTNSGEALIISEIRGLSVSSNCEGFEFTPTSTNSLSQEWIVSGSALNCTHSLIYTQHYVSSDYGPDNGQLLSIVYAIQDTTVV